MGAKTAAAMPAAAPAPLDPELAEALKAPPLPQYPQYDVSMSLEAQPLNDPKGAADAAVVAVEPAPPRDGFSVKTASLFFGSSSLGASIDSMERWQPGEEPMIVMPSGPDPDMKVTASLPVAVGRSVKGRRKHRQQGRGQQRQPARQDAGRAPRPVRREGARPAMKNVSPRRSISKPAARRCAARSRWRRW